MRMEVWMEEKNEGAFLSVEWKQKPAPALTFDLNLCRQGSVFPNAPLESLK